MKVGDLVKMKPAMFWRLKGTRQEYTEQPLFVLQFESMAVHMAVLYPTTGAAMWALPENYEVISEY